MAAKGSRLRFELGRLEVAGVVVSTAAGLFVVFLLGIYAGRGMAERRLEINEEVVRLPVDVENRGQDPDELTFYETLAREEEAAPPEEEPAERLKKLVSAATLDEEDLPERAPTKPAQKAKADKVQEAKAKPVPKAAPPAPPTQPEARVAVAMVKEKPDLRPPATGGEWSVQVAATRDPRHAESIKRKLSAAGYKTYIVKTRRDGEMYHRVRVGRYPSLETARQVAALLRDEPGVTGAFVASD